MIKYIYIQELSSLVILCPAIGQLIETQWCGGVGTEKLVINIWSKLSHGHVIQP